MSDLLLFVQPQSWQGQPITSKVFETKKSLRQISSSYCGGCEQASRKELQVRLKGLSEHMLGTCGFIIFPESISHPIKTIVFIAES